MSEDQKKPIAVPLDDASLEEVSGGGDNGFPPERTKCQKSYNTDACWRQLSMKCPELTYTKDQRFLHAEFTFTCNKGYFSGHKETLYGLCDM